MLDQNGFFVAIDNMYKAGIEIVKGIVQNWDYAFKKGITPTNYIGDIFGSLGGEPDFGPGSLTGGAAVRPGEKTDGLAEKGLPKGSILRHRSYSHR